MFTVVYSRRFRKELRTLIRSGVFDTDRFENTIEVLRQENILDDTYHDHQLKGDRAGYREYHLSSDLLVIYVIDQPTMTITFYAIGSHTNLFE